MLWLFRYLFGFLTVKFYGDFPATIFNFAAKNRIFLWNTKLCDNGIISCISVNNFKKLPYIIYGSGIRVHITEKHGLPFKIRKNRKRLGIMSGAIICAVFLKLISGYIWIIDISGNNKVKSTEIISALNEIGIHEGINKKSINPKTQREKLLLKLDSLAWASLNIEGCRLTVNVTETKKNENNIHLPSNLKAKTDGIIKKIDITSGNSVVKPGDAVKQGDVIVSGIIENADGTEFVYSAGTVTATTEHKITLYKSFKETVPTENGKIKTKRVLELFTLKIPLYLGSETEKYHSETSSYTFSLFGQSLPVKLYKKDFRFIENSSVQYNTEELKEKLTKQLETNLKKNDWLTYEITDISFSEDENGLTLLAVITAEEDIVYSEELIISNYDNTQTEKP